LHQAIRKYGIDNFSFEVILSVITNKYDLIEFEKYFIKEYDCCLLDGPDKGYNISRGGEYFDPELASYLNRQRVASGTHYLQSERADKIRKEVQKKRLESNTHNFQGEKQSIFCTNRNLERVANGTNPFAGELGRLNNLKRIEAGTHNFTIVRTCPHCNLTGRGNNMLRYHFDNCKKLSLDTQNLTQSMNNAD
jgi:hypothetical protein